MTVCVAAICEGSSIIGASDRMLTQGNVQFQPPSTKIYQLTTSIALMVAGDMGVQAEVIGELRAFIASRLAEEPTPEWFNVKDVADWYAFYVDKAKSRRATREILIPLGLTQEAFISRQKDLSTELVNKISYDLVNYRIEGTAAIVAGIDRRGAHLFSIINGGVTCQDAVGFVAIGVGQSHANSYMMFARHASNATVS